MDISSIRKWTARGSLAVLDQALFSGANFIVNILLARWLPPEEYGAFAVAMSIFYLLAGLHTAVITEPMMVFGAGKYREQLRNYFKKILWGHWFISIIITILFSLIALILINTERQIGWTFLILSVASPFMFLLLIARRIPYILVNPQWSVAVSSSNFFIIIFGILLFSKLRILSVESTFLLFAISGTIAFLPVILFINMHKKIEKVYDISASYQLIYKDHLKYGKWAVVRSVVVWITGNLNYLILSAFSLEYSAVLRMLQNLLMPMQQVLLALSHLFLPVFAKASSDSYYLEKKVKSSLTSLLLVTILYITAITIFGNNLLNIFYSGKYNNYADLLPFFSLILLPAAGNAVFAPALQSQRKTKHVFISYLISSVSLIVAGLPLITFFNIKGAIIMNIISASITLILLVFFYTKENRNTK